MDTSQETPIIEIVLNKDQEELIITDKFAGFYHLGVSKVAMPTSIDSPIVGEDGTEGRQKLVIGKHKWCNGPLIIMPMGPQRFRIVCQGDCGFSVSIAAWWPKTFKTLKHDTLGHLNEAQKDVDPQHPHSDS